MDDAHPLPTENEVRTYFETCSNWGRWGPDDELGTLNLVTPEKRREAAACVRSGRAISLARPLNTVGTRGNNNPVQHYLRIGPHHAGDYIGIYYHGYATTHIDSLCHVFWEGKMWNGRSASEVTSTGARYGAVTNWATGVSTRGVLIDIPRFRGVPHISLDEPVRGWEIEAAAEKQGVAVRPGDALVVYSGRESYFVANPATAPGVPPMAGLHPDCVPVFRKLDIALLCWDLMDFQPCGYALFDSLPGAAGGVHNLSLVYVGLPLLDNAKLDTLAEACAEEDRYEFLLNVGPLQLRGGTGSPVNPIALL